MINTLSLETEIIFEICQKHFTNVGLPLKPAKGTPLKLSYIWKHIKTLTNKFNEWELSLEEVDAYVKIAANKIVTLPSKQQSLQHIVKYDMLEYCHNELIRQKDDCSDLIIQMQNMHNWLKSVAGLNLVDHLIKRHKPGALSNIIVYYQQGMLSKQYIAFSKLCRKALFIINQQNTVERNFCPDDAALNFIMNYKFVDFSVSIKKILEN